MKLENIRTQIDITDLEIIKLLKKRFKLVKKIKLIKDKNKIPVVDKSREEAIYFKIKKFAQENDIRVSVLVNIFKVIIRESKKNQKI